MDHPTPSGQVVGGANETASALKDAFFEEVPVGDSCELDGTAPEFQPLAHQPLTPEEVRRAVLGAQPHQALGEDGIPAIAWRELWPVVGRYIFRLFEASLRASYVPQAWEIAKIVPLRKPDKADYTSAKAYRPISLLPTLSKALEAVVAERLSYLAEEHSLLPKNRFGARKRRSTVQALSLIQEKIYDAWRDGMVLSLVSFDVKGAYNGVNRSVLLRRLRARQIPEELVKWIEAFCTARQASIGFREPNIALLCKLVLII